MDNVANLSDLDMAAAQAAIGNPRITSIDDKQMPAMRVRFTDDWPAAPSWRRKRRKQ